MSHKYQGDTAGEAGEEEPPAASAPPRSRQSNGTTGEHHARRSWRPCQMLNQDGEMNPHHHHSHHHPHRHHHHPAGRGPPRHRRRPPSGQGQSQGQAQSPGVTSPGGPSESQDAEPRPVQQFRPAVTRYRRHGDPNPRLRNHRQKQHFSEIQDSTAGVEERGVSAEVPEQPCSSVDPATHQLQDSASHQTPVAVVTPTNLLTGPAAQNEHLQPENAPPKAEEDLHEHEAEQEEESKNVKDGDREQKDLIAASSSGSHDNAEQAERVEEDQEDVMDNAEEDPAAQGSEITDLCSDTESAASLSMDGPLHSPPPLQSPTPPSSPEVPPFPQVDHFSEDISMSSLPDNDPLPEEEEEDCSESCSLSHSTSCSESYPKTYADFYTESHQKSYAEPVYESYSEPKSHPNSFPEPLKASYPELHREPRRQSSRRTEPNKAQQETRPEPFSHRLDNVQKGAPSSPIRQGRDRCSRQSPPDRSVGCRLHHYDGQSDGEGDSADKSPLAKSGKQAPRQPQTQTKTSSSGQMSSGETYNDRSAVGNPSGEPPKGSGDAISLAIKDIKEAIEGVKTKTVRSPYTPDQPMEPIWVMRQEISPTEDAYPLQATTGHSSPHSPSQSASESPSRYASVPLRDHTSPLRAESSRSLNPQHYHHHHHQGHQSQQRDGTRTYAQPQQYAPPTLTQHQPCQHQQQQPQQSQTQAQPQSPQQKPSVQEIRRALPPFPTFVDVPGPCDPEDLIDGIIFAATYLGCTHLLSERTPTKSARMQQAQEAMSRVRAAQKQAKNRKKSPDGEAPSTAEVDLFMSTQRIKVLNADTQESLMDLPLRTISYIADIGNMVVLMARGKMVRSRSAQENLDQTDEQTTMSNDDRRLYRMICHVFESEDAQLIAQSIGQSFSVAYQEFLRANGIDPEDLSQREYSDLLNTQDMYNDDLIHFSKSENCRDVYIEKQKGEILGVVIVESGWGSILPTVIIASMMHAGPAEKSGRLNIGDQIMTVNGTSLVGLPLSTCQSIIKGLKSQSRIKMNIVRCPPVTMVLIRRPDLRYQLGFSVQNGIICSLMRGGIAERGGVRVGHRIIEINSQSVVATPHEKIVQILSNAMGEIHMKTMPAAMYRLLTAQEQPVYI
ncbi:amyloid-beta A4 precursor protein-binding family A member 1-like [Melanotaenia boesemani]|uniref:amyloid-beta A4 precursor protein-binding family A member 1-like n=1 Tax=Melanotaenia boesemani TaxID=1250792 RepID=UPI001C03EFE8|nr:amyloid-beta A4 precursor protein-binding family A member 1-like [Melanotaenia boesemani]XP_041825907.1 amyloid-beta A4 precursor protein-binding family A member 1-like [Melanotaenia boesemani]